MSATSGTYEPSGAADQVTPVDQPVETFKALLAAGLLDPVAIGQPPRPLSPEEGVKGRTVRAGFNRHERARVDEPLSSPPGPQPQSLAPATPNPCSGGPQLCGHLVESLQLAAPGWLLPPCPASGSGRL
jgi:hypothetical protein